MFVLSLLTYRAHLSDLSLLGPAGLPGATPPASAVARHQWWRLALSQQLGVAGRGWHYLWCKDKFCQDMSIFYMDVHKSLMSGGDFDM